MGLRQIFMNFVIFIFKKVSQVFFSQFFDLFLMIFDKDMLFYKP